MSIVKGVLDVAMIILAGVVLITLIRGVSIKESWSYWEKFMRSKEQFPSPWPEYSRESKEHSKTHLKRAGKILFILILLIAVRILID